MKKHIVLVLLGLFSSAAIAQKMTVGIKGGLNLASLKISAGGLSASSNDLFSFHGGFYGTIMNSEKFGFQPEFLYSAQGGKGSGGSGNFNLGYINIPVMMRYTFTPGVSLQAGPQLSFLLNATVDGTDIKSVMNTMDFGACFGLGVDMPSGVNFAFRYNIGFSNTLTSAATSGLSGLGFGNLTMTNQVIQFSLGVKLTKDEAK